MKALLTAVAVTFAFQGFAFAEEKTDDKAKTSTKIESVKPATEANKPTSGQDADEIITNKKMRAESGSKSKWSIGSALAYNGGSLETPLNEKRPDLTGGQGQTLVASFGGNVGVGYKASTTDRISLDVGVRWITPLQKDAPKGYRGDRMDASNPSITYSKIGRVGDLQSQFSVGPTAYTATNLRRNGGYLAALDVQENMNYEIGKSGLSLGLYSSLQYNVFDKSDASAKENSADFSFGVVPYAEYVLNDTFNLRTVFNWFIYDHVRASDAWTFTKNEYQQSFGLGISVTRDIFLYPNVQFQPFNIRADMTNLALSANINVF